MRVWLASFVLVFAAVELFQWVKQVGGFHPTGLGLILCGLGLAAISNAGRIAAGSTGSAELVEGELAEGEALQAVDLQAVEPSASATESAPIDRSQDSISFKVRSPWR